MSALRSYTLTVGWWTLLIAWGAWPAASPRVLIQSRCNELYRYFHDVVSDRAAVLVELTPTNRLFSTTLREQPEIMSLLRTDARGVVVNEVVREKGIVRGYRSVAGQKWFRAVRTSRRPFYAVVGKKEAPQALLWAEPVTIAVRGTRRFVGVVVAKVDFLQCLRNIAAIAEVPFRVVVDGIPVFSHRWEGVGTYDTASIEIPGLGNVLVYEARGSVEETSAFAGNDTLSEDTPGDVVRSNSTPAGRRSARFSRVSITQIAMLAVFLCLLVERVTAAVRRRRILRQVLVDVNGEDRV